MNTDKHGFFLRRRRIKSVLSVEAILGESFPKGAIINRKVKTTRYFEEQVMRKRTNIERDWCERALQNPLRREQQPDGRIRHWAYIEQHGKYLRVVTLEDGETVHNAFFDRSFKEEKP